MAKHSSNRSNEMINQSKKNHHFKFSKQRWVRLVVLFVIIILLVFGVGMAISNLNQKEKIAEPTFAEKIMKLETQVNNNEKDANKTIDELLNLSKEAESKEDTQKIDELLAAQYANKQDYKKAIEYDLKIIASTEDKIILGYKYGNLADTYFLDGQNDMAIEAINKGLDVIESVKDSENYGLIKSELEGRKQWL